MTSWSSTTKRFSASSIAAFRDRQAQTDTSRWLSENAWRYGFIQRYPEGSEEETGYAWHPWHYRYVGEGAAGNMHSLGITLEEYILMFYSEEASVVYDKT